MKLITKELEKKFLKYPQYSQDGKGLDAEVILKVFNPYGSGTWLFTELWQEGSEWMGFGWAELFGDFEAGYISLSELEDIRIDLFGCKMPLERDKFCDGMTVRQLIKQSGARQAAM